MNEDVGFCVLSLLNLSRLLFRHESFMMVGIMNYFDMNGW